MRTWTGFSPCLWRPKAKKLIALRNTAGKAFNMASYVAALHHTMKFRFKAEFGDEIGLQKYLAWKRTWYTETGKLSPSYKPKGSLENKAWLKKTQSCQSDGSKEKEAWLKKKLEGHQKRLTKRMAVAAQQVEAMRMVSTKSVAAVIEENKSAQAALQCKSCGESGHESHASLGCKNFVARRPPTCGNCGENGHQTWYCRS